MARRLGGTDAEICACGHDNPPAANWCARCGAALGVEPSFTIPGEWNLGNVQRYDIESEMLHGDTPRLWLSGGAGAWYVSEDSAGSTRARIFDNNGFFPGIPRAGIDLGAFRGLRAIEATRLGLFALTDRGLYGIFRPQQAPWDWADHPTRLELPKGTVIGFARAAQGKLYLLTRDERRLHLWSGSHHWRAVASTAALDDDTAWFDTASSDSGDLLFWGGGIVGAFEAAKGRLSTRLAPNVAALPVQLSARIAKRPAGDWRAWSLKSPVLARGSDEGIALIGYSKGEIHTAEVKNIDDVLAAVPVDSAVLARTSNAILRIGLRPEGAAVTRTNAGTVDEAAAAAMSEAAAFIVPGEQGAQIEIASGRDRAPSAPTVRQLGNARGTLPAGAGFEPLATCTYTGSKDAHQVWIVLEPGGARGGTALQHILRIPLERHVS